MNEVASAESRGGLYSCEPGQTEFKVKNQNTRLAGLTGIDPAGVFRVATVSRKESFLFLAARSNTKRR